MYRVGGLLLVKSIKKQVQNEWWYIVDWNPYLWCPFEFMSREHESIFWCDTDSTRKCNICLSAQNILHSTPPGRYLHVFAEYFCLLVCIYFWNELSVNGKLLTLVFSKWRDFRPVRWIRRIGQIHPCMNRIQLQPCTSTENILV